MDINSSHAARHSEQDFSRKFSTYVDSGVGVIHVRTHEIIRAAMALRKQIIVDGGSVKEWDIVNGFKTYTRDNVNDVLVTGDSNIDIGGAFAVPLDNLKNNAGAQNIMCYVYLNPHVFMEGNPTLTHLLMTYSHVLPATNTVVVVLTPDMPLPVDSGANILSMHFDPPGLGELKDSLTGILSGVMEDFSEGEALTEQEIEKVCYVGAGMTKNHFEMYSALAIVEAGREGKTALTVDDLIGGVSIGKTDVVNSNDILELYPSTDIKNVGGLENLKSWVAKRRDCYSDDAKEFGIEAPKGMVLVGLPGTGKSLVAKAIASELGVPLVRLDFGRVFNSLVGASESRMRTALKMVETMSPCVLFCDEIDKGLGGIGGSGDSGTSNRVLGSFLTWLQDCQHPVFVMVTANNVTGLPPEMLRRGRFDAIFSTSLPNADERRTVLGIHLRLRGRRLKDYEAQDIEEVIALSEGYVPAEIESAVKDALVDAFNEDTEMTMAHVKKALTSMVPLSKAFAPQIAAMNEWAKNNATPAGLQDDEKAKAAVGNARRVTSRKRG